jgi:hypothetical protein
MQEHTRNARFNPNVQIHNESYVLIEGFTKNRVSLNSFLSQGVTKTPLSYLLSQRWAIQTSQGSPHQVVAQGQPLTVLLQE